MDFFSQHGTAVLIFLAFFPRLTLLIASFATGGWLWWLGWIFAPHLLVAILALPYWDSNPVLVIMAWMFALVGTSGETETAMKSIR